ncbi:alpha-(1,3)-fucosyltransferase C-like [Chironomus tepperi]|uniref:alpha-(1,3)-fucosyltransferase C-like n=1 Tax=Chironomus tepperi TaxID=113505 RepID=UPI00391F80D8
MDKEVQGEEYLKDMNCPVTNCIFSHNRKYLPSLSDYDAIVFHVAQPMDVKDVLRSRKDNQIYIMANQESPVHTAHNLKRDNNFFNMTFTYRLDSDILFPYATIMDIKSGVIVAPSRNANWMEPENVTDPRILNIIKSKSKMAAWFVSRCKSFSNREVLTQKLQQFINIDIYGKCGNHSCPRTDQNQCLDMLNSTYKFYLAFENSICTDYMTEKVFLNMDNYVIPILYNGVTDMQHFLPPKSYINVNDFNSIEELANYLKFLDINPQEYANYFWWKKYYKIDNNPYPNSYCKMCMKLNEWDVEAKRQQYVDVAKWYNYKTCNNKRVNF